MQLANDGFAPFSYDTFASLLLVSGAGCFFAESPIESMCLSFFGESGSEDEVCKASEVDVHVAFDIELLRLKNILALLP